MSDRSEEIARQAAATRFGLRRAELAADLSRLLGRHVRAEPSADPAEGARLTAEFLAGRGAAAPNEWAIVSRHWGGDEADTLTATLHRLSYNLGSRPAWLLTADREPQAVLLQSDAVLDNPLGFAAVATDEVRLLDRDVTAGLWLLRHSHHFRAVAGYTWELNVWGEPWLSATTRALRRLA
jgi:hypothetical protein